MIWLIVKWEWPRGKGTSSLWFEASEHYTNSTEDHKGVSNGSEHNSNIVTGLMVNDWVAECPEPANDTKP